MKLAIVLVFTMFVLAQNAYSNGLEELIKQNVEDSTQSYEQMLIQKEQQKNAPRLWIHVQSEEQKKAVSDILGWFKSIKLGGKTVELRPIQSVEVGVPVSTLRFFKKQDAKEAEQLHIELKKVLPLLKLKNLSRQYRSIEWINPGHYELWLSPDIKTLTAPQ